MLQNPVGWFEIYVNDMPRAKSFYETVFAVKLVTLEVPAPEMWAFPMQGVEGAAVGGASGALVKMDGFPGGNNSVIVYFSVNDCGVSAAAAEQAGGKIIQPKTSIGQYGFIALVTDTEGNVIGLHNN